MPIVLAVVVSSNNLVPCKTVTCRDNGYAVRILYSVQCEYYTVFNLIEIPSYPFSLFKAERSKNLTLYSGTSQYAIEVSTPSLTPPPLEFLCHFFHTGSFPLESPVKLRV